MLVQPPARRPDVSLYRLGTEPVFFNRAQSMDPQARKTKCRLNTLLTPNPSCEVSARANDPLRFGVRFLDCLKHPVRISWLSHGIRLFVHSVRHERNVPTKFLKKLDHFGRLLFVKECKLQSHLLA